MDTDDGVGKADEHLKLFDDRNLRKEIIGSCKEAHKAVIKQSSDKLDQKATRTIHKRPQEYSVNQSINQSIHRSINQSIKWSVDQSINQSIDQSINQSNDQSINQSINQSEDAVSIYLRNGFFRKVLAGLDERDLCFLGSI